MSSSCRLHSFRVELHVLFFCLLVIDRSAREQLLAAKYLVEMLFNFASYTSYATLKVSSYEVLWNSYQQQKNSLSVWAPLCASATKMNLPKSHFQKTIFHWFPFFTYSRVWNPNFKSKIKVHNSSSCLESKKRNSVRSNFEKVGQLLTTVTHKMRAISSPLRRYALSPAIN